MHDGTTFVLATILAGGVIAIVYATARGRFSHLISNLRLMAVPALAGAVALASRSAPSLWEDWFAESGHAPIRFAGNREFEDLLLAIGAARSGLGVAIAPRTAIGEDIDRGILVAPFGFIRRPAGYSLSIRSSDVKAPALVRLADWLSEAGAEPA